MGNSLGVVVVGGSMPLCLAFTLVPLWAHLLPQSPQSGVLVPGRPVPQSYSQHGCGGACKAAGHHLTFSSECSLGLVTLPLPLRAPLLWAPVPEGADTAGAPGFLCQGTTGEEAELQLQEQGAASRLQGCQETRLS